MRDILFRGKTKGGKWVEGYYVKVDHYINYSEIHVIIPKNTILYPRREFSDYVEVIPETVGQFTGLYDKNGVKIFEGDIVRVAEFIAKVNGIYRVIYSEKTHEYALERSTDFDYHYFSFSELNGFAETSEVIGNGKNCDLIEKFEVK